MQVICLEEEAFYALVEEVAELDPEKKKGESEVDDRLKLLTVLKGC